MVLYFSVISSIKMLYLGEEALLVTTFPTAGSYIMESMLREMRKIMNQSPMATFSTRW